MKCWSSDYYVDICKKLEVIFGWTLQEGEEWGGFSEQIFHFVAATPRHGKNLLMLTLELSKSERTSMAKKQCV